MCQLVDCRLHRKQTLCGTVAPVCTGRHVVGVDYIADKAERLCLAVQGDGFVSGQTHRGGTVFAVGTGIGQGVQVNALYDAVPGSAQTDVHLHLVTGGRCRLAFHPAEDDLGGLFGLPCDECRVYLADCRLLCAKTTADAGFGHPHHRLGDMQGVGDVAAGMENDLGGAENIQSAVGINGTVGAEGLHHRLLTCLGVVDVVDHHIAACDHRINITGAALVMGAEIAFVVGTHGAEAFPVVLRVHKNGVILGGVEIQHCFQHIVFHLDELQRLIHALLVLACYDRHHVAYKTDMTVDEQTVVGACLRIGLSCLRVPAGVLRHIFPGKNRLDAGHFFSHGGVDGPHHGVGVGRTQQLDDEAVGGDHVIHVHRLSRYQLHGVLFAERLVYRIHSAASFCFFHSRKFMMPRSCPS